MRRPPPAVVEVLDPVADARLDAVGAAPAVWQDGDVLTIAVRRDGEAPYLGGTVHERLRPAGAGVWALRLHVPELRRACIEYGLGETLPEVWRGADADDPAAPEHRPLDVPAEVIGRSELAERHRVRFSSTREPQALLVCADGEGIGAWAALTEAGGIAAAFVGIESAGLSWSRGDEIGAYEPRRDPRAQAYLPTLDPPYFDAHLAYVVEEVLPWADARLGASVPRVAFGVSNGAAFAAAAAARRPELFAAVIAFSLAEAPRRLRRPLPPHALVAGRLEPAFHAATTRFAARLRRRGADVRLRTPVRGHDWSMWRDEFLPALAWLLERTS